MYNFSKTINFSSGQILYSIFFFDFFKIFELMSKSVSIFNVSNNFNFSNSYWSNILDQICHSNLCKNITNEMFLYQSLIFYYLGFDWTKKAKKSNSTVISILFTMSNTFYTILYTMSNSKHFQSWHKRYRYLKWKCIAHVLHVKHVLLKVIEIWRKKTVNIVCFYYLGN